MSYFKAVMAAGPPDEYSTPGFVGCPTFQLAADPRLNSPRFSTFTAFVSLLSLRDTKGTSPPHDPTKNVDVEAAGALLARTPSIASDSCRNSMRIVSNLNLSFFIGNCELPSYGTSRRSNVGQS